MTTLEEFSALPRQQALLAGNELNWIDQGAGRPILFVHGSPSHAGIWRQALPRLDGRRLIIPDLLGFGKSAAPGDGVNFLQIAAALEALLKHLGIGSLDLVVHDWGGPIGVGACLRAGIAVERLVLVNTTFLPDFQPPAGWEMFTAPGTGEAMIVDGNAWCAGLPTAMKAAAQSAGLHQFYLAPSERIGMRRTILRLERLEGFAELLAEPKRQLCASPPQTRIVWGENDLYFQQEYLRLRQVLPAADFVEIPGGGHFPQEDAPEATFAAIVDWLR